MISCDNNSIVGNTASNNYNGISLSGSYNNISDNFISSNEESGVRIYGNNITISNNTLLNNNRSGINFSGYNISITMNLMKECGVYFAGSIKEISSCNIDLTNLVNERPLYYYINETWLGPDDFLNAGQVILINCNDSLILNLNVSHGSSGITLYGCHNNIISNNDASYNNIYGLFLNNCDNNSISRNLVSNKADYGISLYGNYNNLSNNQASNNFLSGISLCGDYNILSNNNASNNFLHGLYLRESAYNLVLNNIIENNFNEIYSYLPFYSGLYLRYCYNNVFVSNHIKNNNQTGLVLDSSNNNTFTSTSITNNKYNGIWLIGSKNNTFRANNISNNYANGIKLFGSDNNKLIENSISNNSEIGLFFIVSYDCSENNSIYYNNFQDNGINAEDNCINNKWDDGNIGNYWNDYEGIDANDDGIGDTPYNITGSAGTQDNYPIWDDGDNILPSIIIISPDSNEIFGTEAPAFEISINESNIESTWYTIDGGLTNITFSGLNGSIDQNAWSSAPEGEITLTFYAQDMAGNIGTGKVVVIKSISSKPVIIGYDLLFLISSLSVILLIIIRKINKS